MRFAIASSICLFTVLALSGCGASSPILATIGADQLTLAEFEQSFAKNNGGRDSAAVSTPEARKKYLDLLVKFRMKVQEARRRGLDRDSAIQQELDVYRASVAQSYLLERELVNPAIHRAYDRRKEEVRGSHILLRLDPAASPADTAAAYARALELIGRLSTEPFDSLARKYSEDPSGATNGGDLGYFIGGRMVPEFEDACYDMKPGEVTKTPVRSQFGYHIIKMTGRRPNLGAVHIGHILLRYSPDMLDTAMVRDTAWAIYQRMKNGLPFVTAVRSWSQDPGSVQRDGDIGFFERDRLPAGLGDLFNTIPADSIMEPFRMPYGFHLIKFLGWRPVAPFTDLEKEIRSVYQQQRYQYDYNRYLAALYRAYPPTVDSTVLAELSVAFDTTRASTADSWSDTLSSALRAKTIVTVGGRGTTVQNLVDRVIGTNQFRPTVLKPSAVHGMVKQLTDALVIEEHSREAAQRDPQFVALMKEYEEGILLYRLEQDELWNKLGINDSLLVEYFTANRESYRWPDRVNFAEIFVPKDSLAQVCLKEIKKGKDFGAVAVAYTARQQYVEKKGEWGLQPVTMNELAQRAAAMPVDSVSAPFRYQGGWSIVKTLAKEAARLKTFEEARPEVLGTYQDIAVKQREQQWLEELRARYPAQIRTEVLEQAFKQARADAK